MLIPSPNQQSKESIGVSQYFLSTVGSTSTLSKFDIENNHQNKLSSLDPLKERS